MLRRQQAPIGPVLSFNAGRLKEDFFSGRGPEQYDIIVHELAHAWNEKAMEHGPGWGESCCTVASRLLSANSGP